MKNKEKLCIVLLKYIPIICALFMLLHVITLMLGHCLCLSELVTLSLVSIMVIFWSHVFKFCIIHRLASLYTILVLWCCYIQRFIGFGDLLEPLRIIFMYIGIILFILIGVKYFKRYKKSKLSHLYKNTK